jgi:tetratricopeptide (TPR) repeat protein
MSSSRATPPDRWILGRAADLPLVLLTPLLALGVFAVGRSLGFGEGLIAAGFALSIAHYLPGMLRAYGDRELFARFRLRLLAAPVVFVSASVAAAWASLQVLELLVLFWGPWHWLMQTYGFARIYDARAGRVDRTTARLDYALIVLGFGAALLVTGSFSNYLRDAYSLGAPFLPTGGIEVLRAGWLAATCVVFALYVANAIRATRRGEPPSPRKLWLLASTLPFFAFTASFVQRPLEGYVLFEICHDVQYLALVWMINRNRVERDASKAGTGGLLRFLFRPHAALVLAYLGLCLAFGATGHVYRTWIDDPFTQRIALSTVSAMALLHYYLDGFIWKIREPANQASLDLALRPIEPGSPLDPLRQLFSARWMSHAALWILVVIPVGWLAVVEARGQRPDARDVERHLAEAFPRSALPHFHLCRDLLDTRELAEAREHCERALELSPDWATVHNNLGVVAGQQGDLARAERELRRAVELDPDYVQARGNLDRVVAERRRRMAIRSTEAR